MFRRVLALSALLCAVPVAAESPVATAPEPEVMSVSLACFGAGSANRTTGATAYGAGGWGSIVGETNVAFDDQIMVELSGGSGRIRMPRSMLPRIRGGKDGWFEVDNVRWSDNEITGTIQVNVFNSPKLRLDRLQGMVAINGKSGDYTGRCEPFDPNHVERRF